MNRLELAKRVHLLMGAGTGTDLPGTRPTTTLNQSADLARMVMSVDEAWRAIQTARKDWLFMRSEGSLPLVPGVQRYSLVQQVSSITSVTTTATLNTPVPHDFNTGQDGYVFGADPSEYNGTFDMTASDSDTLTYTMLADPTGSEATASPRIWLAAHQSLAQLDEVRPYFAANRNVPFLLVYKTSIGTSDEQPMHFVEPYDFEGYFDRNSFATSVGRPVYYTILPNRRIAVFPRPDVEYTVRIPFRRRVQLLAADADEPAMPEEFHPMIAYKAIMDYMGFQENSRQFQNASRLYSELWEDLNIQQLPRVSSVFGAVR